ncbi:hypothetical protein AB0M43_27580 [Longispora sp. NPDC051575]|uniref:hypothetical protein n=1 Tax=Longispora sp. NPDC051575 TaxID=3154943 RepID=UPI003412A906
MSLLLVAALHAVTPLPAVAPLREPPLPRVAVEISDGADRAAPGDLRVYRITVRSYEPAGPVAVTVVARLPVGARVRDPGPAAVSADGTVSWTTGVPPGGSWETTVAVRMPARQPDGPARLAGVACVVPDGFDRPAVCASDLDEAVPGPVVADPGDGGAGAVVAVAGGLPALATVGAAGQLWWWRRRVGA